MTPTLELERPEDYLARVAQSDFGRAYKAMAIERMVIEPGSTVADLGCGTGADLEAFAGAVGPTGRVIGIDHNDEAVAQARAAARLANVEVRVGDIQRLDLPPGSVDRVHTDRVLQHVPRPGDVLAGVSRMLRPGGLAAFAEPDWDSLVIDHPDPTIPTAYRSFITDRVIRNPRIGRELPRLCQQAGLTVQQVFPFTAVYRETRVADHVFGFQRVTQRAVAAGHLTDDQAHDWLHHLNNEECFVSMTLFLTVAAVAARASR